MRSSRLAFVTLCSCHKLFGLDPVGQPSPIDAADAPPADAADPMLAKWTAATSLPAGRDYNYPHAAFVGDTLYMIGGYDLTVPAETAVVYRATVTAGDVGVWTTTTPLPAPRALGDVVTIGSRIYVVGGANGGGAQTSVYIGESTAGTIPSWSVAPALPDARKGNAAAASNGFLYAIGGADGLNKRDTTVFYSPVQGDGSLVGWQVTSALPAPRANLGAVAARGFLYAIGGDDDASVPHADVYVAAVNPTDGSLAPWAATTSLPLGRMALAAVTDGSYIYVIGGLGGSATAEVRYSRIGDDGTLGTWQTSEPLLVPRYRHSGVLANGHLFVLGGATTATSVEHSAQGE